MNNKEDTTVEQVESKSPESKIENFICPNCGGRLKWNIRKENFMCSSCSSPFNLDMDNSKVIEHPMSEYSEREEQCNSKNENTNVLHDIVLCKTCGAQIEFGENQTATVCPMCGSTQVDSVKQNLGIPPDGVIPFRVDYDDAQSKFNDWIKKRWFAPNALKASYQLGKLNGIYIPFWTYDVEAAADYIGFGGIVVEHKDSKGNVTTDVKWYPVAGSVSQFFNDYPICAGDSKLDNIMNGVLPFNTQGGSYPYSGGFLSGFSSEHYVISAVEGFEKAKEKIKDELRSMVENDISSKGYERTRIDTFNESYGEPGYKQILAPVWTSNFAYGGKKYSYAINGETGKVTGERPYSAIKITIAILIAVSLLIAFIAWDLSTTEDSLDVNSVVQTAYTEVVELEDTQNFALEEINETYYINPDELNNTELI